MYYRTIDISRQSGESNAVAVISKSRGGARLGNRAYRLEQILPHTIAPGANIETAPLLTGLFSRTHLKGDIFWECFISGAGSATP
jgi:hypothetical protein